MNVPARRPPRDLNQAATQGLGGVKHPMISRNGNRFTLIDTAGSQRPWQQLSIDVVITDAGPNVNRMYFEGDYEPGAGEPPACFSDNGTGPSREARSPQHPTCTGCPQAAWGSRVTVQGKQVPACQSGKKLAVMVIGDQAGLVYEFRVPPGSFNGKPETDPWEGGWLWYCNALKGASRELFDVVTRISFKPNTMGVLTFKPIAQLDQMPDVQTRLHQLWDQGWNALEAIVGATDVAIDPATWQAGRRTAVSDQTQRPNLPPPPAQNQALPFSPPGTVVTQGFPNGTLPQIGQQQANQQVEVQQGAPRARRPRRTKAEMEAAAQGQVQANAAPVSQPLQGEVMPPFVSGTQQVPATGAPVADPDIPPFLQRNPAPAAKPAPSFGMEQPQAPPPGMQANLDAAFALPLK